MSFQYEESDGESPTYVFIVRHGARADKDGKGSTTTWRERCAPGHEYDPPLTAVGQLEAMATGTELARLQAVLNCDVLACVSSPFMRCVETAQIILATMRTTAQSAPPGSSGAVGAFPGTVILDPAFAEWLGSDLFPTQPKHLTSPRLASSLAEAMAPLSSRGVAPLPVEADRAALAAEAALIASHPESKPSANARIMAGFDALYDRLVHPPSTSAAASAPTPRPRAVIIVTHQYCCHMLACMLLGRNAPGAAAAVGGDDTAAVSAAKPGKKSSASSSKKNWKKDAIAQAKAAACVDQQLLCFGTDLSTLMASSFTVDFAYASFTLVKVTPSQATVLILSQTPVVAGRAAPDAAEAAAAAAAGANTLPSESSVCDRP